MTRQGWISVDRRRAVEASLVALAAWLLYTRVHAPVHMDTARDLLIARDCGAGACPFEGPLSSFARLAQGATWIHLLEAARWAGASVHAIEATVWGLAGAAAGLVYFEGGKARGRAHALLAAVAFAGITPFLVEHPVLWNPSLLPLPAVAFFAAQRAFVERRSLSALLTAALALGVIVDVHLVGILLVPGLIAPVLAARPPSVGAWLRHAACLLAAPLFIVASSWRAVADDGRVLAGHAGPASGLVLALAVASVVLARRIARGGADAAAGGAALVYAILLGGGSLAARKSAQGWYWAPLGPVLAVLAAQAVLTRRKGAWITARRLATGAGMLFVWALFSWTLLGGAGEVPLWTLADAERCAHALAARGWTARQALRGVDAQYGPLLVSPLIAFLPETPGAPPQRDRIVLVKRRGGEGVPLDGGFVARMIEGPPIDFTRAERCVDGDCTPLRPAQPELAGFAGLAYPSRWVLDPARRVDADYVLAFVLPVLTDAPLSVEPDLAGVWEISRDGSGRTVVRVTIRRGQSWLDMGWPPALRVAD